MMTCFPVTAALRSFRRAGLCSSLTAALWFAPVIGHAQPAISAGLGDGGVSPFYVWQGALPAQPGRLLRSEPLEPKLTLPNAGESTRILYTSTEGIGGQAIQPVSGALYLPKGTPPQGGWPLMAWAHGTVGIADICAPSWRGRSERDVKYLGHWLDQGYAVVATDYQGLGTPGTHPYMSSRSMAYGVLDSIRAVQAGRFNLSKKVVLIGQSQGGGATFATAGYAKAYAPELEIRGAVATGTPYLRAPRSGEPSPATDPRRDDKVDGTLSYSFLLLYLMASVKPDLAFETYVTDMAMPVVKLAQTACLGDLVNAIVKDGLTRANSFKKDAAAQAIGVVAAQAAYPTLAPAMPVFMGTGGKDKDVPPAMQKNLVIDACRAGGNIEWHTYPDLDHSGAVNGSLPDSTLFVKHSFAGDELRGNCGSTSSKE